MRLGDQTGDVVICDRCREETTAFTMSYFNTETICLECKALEEAHPKYEQARSLETRAVRAGIYDFPGIGLPKDLQKKGEGV